MKKYEMDAKFLTNWIKGLRSGNYKQGFGIYHDKINNCACAMGVGLLENNIPLNDRGDNCAGEYDPIMEIVKPEGATNSLWSTIYDLNDNQKIGFNQMADWLEQNVQPV